MGSPVGLCLLLIAVPVAAYHWQDEDAKNEIRIIRDDPARYRVKRMAIQSVSTFLRSSKFLGKILGVNRFVRDGDLMQAKLDFMLLDPKHVRKVGNSVFGEADGKLIELNVGRGFPIIFIRSQSQTPLRKLVGANGKVTDGVLYREHMHFNKKYDSDLQIKIPM